MMFIIIICTNYWHYASNWAVKQHCCRTRESLSRQSYSYLQQSYVQVTPGIKTFLVCALQILFMPPPVHYSGGDMMIKMSFYVETSAEGLEFI